MPGYFDPDNNNGMGGNAATDYAAYLASQGGGGPSYAPGTIQSAFLPPVGTTPIPVPAPSHNMHSGRNGVNGSHMSALERIYDSLAHAGNNTPAKQRGPLGSLIHSLFGTDPAPAGGQTGGYSIAPFSTDDPAYKAMMAATPSGPNGTPGGYWGQPSTPAPQPYKPATQLSSSQEINQKINEMLGMPPADMPPPNFAPPDPGFPTHGMMPQMGAAMPYPVADIPPFSIDPPDQHAEGGPIHLERGGYPELWDKPIRRGYFATGGGSHYVEPDGLPGDGRSDHVDAKLSPGEYVMDAESVGMLGNGNNEAGARALDGMRKKLRMQKGKALAKGKFSPDAKAPEEYLAADPISDGMRRSSRKGA